MPKLFHVSENSNIKEFIPLPPPNKKAGVEDNAVWAITDYELANYILPRDCPRVCYRNEKKEKIIAIEKAWIERIKKTELFLYEFNSETFNEIDPIAGYWISRQAVKPKSVTKIEDILLKLSELKVNLKILDHLHDEKQKVIDKYKHFSIIRFRNAKVI